MKINRVTFDRPVLIVVISTCWFGKWKQWFYFRFYTFDGNYFFWILVVISTNTHIYIYIRFPFYCRRNVFDFQIYDKLKNNKPLKSVRRKSTQTFYTIQKQRTLRTPSALVLNDSHNAISAFGSKRGRHAYGSQTGRILFSNGRNNFARPKRNGRKRPPPPHGNSPVPVVSRVPPAERASDSTFARP